MGLRVHSQQKVLTTGEITISGDPTAATFPIEMVGKALACRVEHSGTGFTLTIKDANGYDVLDGAGTVTASGLSLNHDDIGGNPVQGTLTALLAGGVDDETATIHLYVEGHRLNS